MCELCYTHSNPSRKFFIIAKIFDKKGRLLSMAYNSYIKTDPIFHRFAKRVKHPLKEYIHAEMSAFKKLSFNDIKRAHTIKIYRFTKTGKPALAKPCPVCESIINFHNIKVVQYTTDSDPLDMTYEEYVDYRNNATQWIYQDEKEAFDL